MKQALYGHVIIPVIIAVLAFLPYIVNASTTVDSSIDLAQTVTPRLTLPWYDQSAFGSFLYHYPIVIPPGRDQLQPNLEFTYNSANVQSVGVFGDGWSLTIPSIERLNKTGLEDLYDSTTFTSSLAGELLPVSLTDATHGAYGAEVEAGPFSAYAYDSTETWTMTDANGTIYTFGDSSASRVDDPDDPTRVSTWYVSEIRDTNDNFIAFTYTEDDNQLYPATITYTGNGSTEGIFVVTFSLEDRDDVATSYASGFSVTTNQRVSGLTVTADGTTRRTITLSYTTGVNGTRSLLQSITETGYDDNSNAHSLPSTSFTYASDSPSWSQDTGYTLIPSGDFYFSFNSRGSVYTWNYFVGDLNGNGFEDIFRFQRDYNWGVPSDGSSVYLSDGLKTWDDASSDVTLPTPLTTDTDSNSFKDAGTRFADINGDGFVDIVYAASWSSSVNIDEQTVYINDGSESWTEDTGYTLPSGFYFDPIGDGCSSDPQDPGTRILDVNGDGLPDLLRYRENSSINAVYLNNGDGTGWTEASFTLPVPIAGSDSGCYYQASTFTDVNNDQLVDILYLRRGNYSNSTVVYMNTGNGWVEDTRYSIPRSTDLNLNGGYIQIVDINGDGYTDLIDTSDMVYLNNGDGTGWTRDDSNSISFPLDNVVATEGVRLMDVNVDGLLDFVRAELVNTGATGYNDVVYEDVYVAAGSMPNILTGIENSLGASTLIDYEAAHAYVDETGTMANPDLAFSVLTIASITTDDGLGNTSSESYTYEEGDFYYADETDRQFAGFGQVTKTDAVGNTTISYFHQGNDTNSTQGEATDTIAKLGNRYREETYDNSSNLYRVQLFDWQSADLGNDRTFVYLEDELELLYDGDADHTDTATAYSYDTTTGTISTQTDSGEVTGSDDGSYTDTGDDDRTTTYEYATDASGIIVDLPSTITLTDTDGVTVSETRYTYDGLAVGSVETGNMTQEETWIAGTNYAATSFTYDTYGNILTQTDPLGNTTTTTYDTANLYPATITNALSQTQTFEYDAAVGQPTSVTEVNGTVTETDYDGLGRPTEERRSSDAAAATLETTKIWTYDDTNYDFAYPRAEKLRDYLSTTQYKETIQYLDGLNRIIETKILDAAATGYNETETTYDALGRVSSTTLPEASADYGYDSNTVSSDLAESYQYDALDRVTSVTNVLGTTTTDYNGFTKTVTDALSNQKDYVTDGLKRLISVIEYLDETASTTSYTWDAADHLLTTNDALGNVRTFTYDGRGLRLTAEDLHDATDTTFGIWTYTYDDAGNLSTSLSQNNVTVTYGYDELNRQTTEDADSTTGTDTTYSYDSCTNGTGKLCEATTSDGIVTSSSYTASGRLSAEIKTISAVDYTTSYTYDTLGNILTTTHPDSTIITNTYNTMGLLETVTGDSTIITDTTYGPHGQVISQTNANGTTTNYTYDEHNRYRLTGKSTTGYEEGDTTTSTTTTTTRFYPTAGDGYVYKSNAAWDTAHDATSGSGAYYTASTLLTGTAKSTTPSYLLYRTFLPFDTSALPDDATITSATLNVYVYSKKNNDDDGDDFVTVVPTTQASTTTLSTADFDQAGSIDNPTEGIDSNERKDITNVSTNAYLTFTLNSTGRDWISKTDVTKLGLREGHDVIDSAFTSASTTSSQYNYLYTRSSEYTGTTYDPYLEVTYTQTSTTEPEPVASTLQDLSYAYDAIGNITQIVDASDTDSAKTTDYVYDDLYRLTSATNDEAITYVYDAIGNITSRSDLGTYAYDDTDYANPHAVTSILMADGTTTTYSYDNNGNLTSDGTKNYAWDYKNRLTSSGELTETTSTTTTTTTTNFYPTTGDGYTYKSNASWDTAHDATSGSYATATATNAMVGTYKSTSSYFLARTFLPFDTSSLPDDATITNATLKVYVYSKTNNDNDGDDWVTVVQGSQPSTSTLTTADYDLAGSVNSPTEGIDTSERKDITNVTTNAYLSLAFNSTGLGWISNTATTKLALREGHDVIDSAFTSDSTTATRYNRLYYRSSEYADTTYDPYLEVTYTQPSTVTTTTTTNEVSYAYDHTDQRVSKSSEDTTTYYPSGDYSITAGTSTISVSGPAGLTAAIEYDGATSTTETIHADHLGSTNVVTDEDGVMVELLDYNPYGTERINWSSSDSGSADSQKTYIGEYSDDETDLSYLNARYYDSTRGQFLSQDSVFLTMGTDDQRAQTALLDPQLQNSYGYSRNNPMTWKDPDGNFLIVTWAAAVVVAYADIYAPVAITWAAAAVTATIVPLFVGAVDSYGSDNSQLGDAFIEAEMSALDVYTQILTGLNDLDQNGFLDSSGLVDWVEEGGGQLEVNTEVESTATPSDYNVDEYLASPREFSFDGQPNYYSDQSNYVTNGGYSISNGDLDVPEYPSQ